MISSFFASRRRVAAAALVLIAVILLSVNIVAQRFATSRLDLTAGRLYTLSSGTDRTLAKIDEPITLRFYYSTELGDRLPPYGVYAERVRELLEQYAAAAHGKLRLEIYHPQPFSRVEDQAVAFGLQGVPLNQQGDQVYFGLAGTNSTDDRQVIPFFSPQREPFLEYDLTKLVHNLVFPKKPVVGLITTLPLMGDMMAMMRGMPSEPMAVMTQIEQLDEVKPLSVELSQIPADIDVLMIVHPQNLPPKTLYAIDQFVLKGGKALVFVDPYSELEAAARNRPGMPGGPTGSDLEPLFKSWGIRMLPGVVAGDRRDAERVNVPVPGRGEETLDYVAWLGLGADNLNRSDPITADLHHLTLASAGILEKRKGATTTVEPLLMTSPDSMQIPVGKVEGLPDVAALLDDFKPSLHRYMLAARITGIVKTAFPKGPPPEKPAKPAKPGADQRRRRRRQRPARRPLLGENGEFLRAASAGADGRQQRLRRERARHAGRRRRSDRAQKPRHLGAPLRARRPHPPRGRRALQRRGAAAAAETEADRGETAERDGRDERQRRGDLVAETNGGDRAVPRRHIGDAPAAARGRARPARQYREAQGHPRILRHRAGAVDRRRGGRRARHRAPEAPPPAGGGGVRGEMRQKGFFVLAAAAILSVALAAYALSSGNSRVSTAPRGERALPGLAQKLPDIYSIALFRSDLKATFVRRGTGWAVAEKGGYPADTGKIGKLAIALADLRLVEPKTRRRDLYPRLEVEKPGTGKSTLVTVKDKAGKTLASLIVGKERYDRLGTGKNGVYVRKPGDPQSWLAGGSLDVSGKLPGWLDAKIVDVSEDRVARVSLTAPDGKTLVVARPSAAAPFSVEGAPAGAKFKDRGEIATPAGALESLDLEDVAPAAKLPPPTKGTWLASYHTFGGLDVRLTLFDRDRHSWVAVAASGSGKAAEEAKEIDARVAGWSYRIPSYKALPMRKTLADMLIPAPSPPAKK
jgi:ABC-type uncharacterized transport system involved in gliding motility auxiliary subunit